MTSKKTPKLQQELQETGTPSNTDPALMSDAKVTIASSLTSVSNTKRNLAMALAKAQLECQNVTMNRVNPHFRSKYADLAAVRDAIIPVFNKHGLAVIQAPTTDGFSGFCLETRIIHTSGEEIIWQFPLPSDFTKMQSIGSAISYARRYTLSAIGGIASEEDDDGNAAQAPYGGGALAAGAQGKPGGIVL